MLSLRRKTLLAAPLVAVVTAIGASPARAQSAAPGAPPAPAAAPAAPAPAQGRPAAGAAPTTPPAAAPGDASSSAPTVLTPPPPPPWTNAPTSAAGTQLLSPSTDTAGAGAGVVSPASADQEARIRALEARIAADEEVAKKEEEKNGWLSRLKLTGYVQPQLVWRSFNDAASPNLGTDGALPNGVSANAIIGKADGTSSNQSFFRIRRARLKTIFSPTEYAKLVFEIDPFPNGGLQGPGTGTVARNVEAVGIAKWTPDVTTEFGLGMFKIPFGFEVLQSDADRPLIERTWSEGNLTPGEYDIGLRAYTTALDKKLTFQAALVNGTTLGEKTFTVAPDLNRGKDLVGRLNYNFGPFDAGVSGYYGQGARVDATALRFKQFPRWGVDLEAALHHTLVKMVGETRLFGELVIAQNLDRGVNYAFGPPAIPANVNSDVGDKDERGLFVRLEQDLTEWFTFAARYDFYSPDTAQKNDARDTYAFVGVIHFTKGLQAMLEFDHAIDNVHKPLAQPPSKQIETFSGVLQARF